MMGRLTDVFALIVLFSANIAAATAFDTTTSTPITTTHGVSGVCIDGLPCKGPDDCGSPLYCQCTHPPMVTSINNTGKCSPVTQSAKPVTAATTYRIQIPVPSSQNSVSGDIGLSGNQTSPLTAVAAPKKPNQNAPNQSLSMTTSAESITAVSTFRFPSADKLPGSPNSEQNVKSPSGNQASSPNKSPIAKTSNQNANAPSVSSLVAGSSGKPSVQQKDTQQTSNKKLGQFQKQTNNAPGPSSTRQRPQSH
ncbi:uncharacterized protein LOC129595258 [Paramacrobiotus metropolitanus]|uniref:uncharacterized protein LOC129595258 n=1 Tax=Paramacrobiotus metropolitanus TaxID=2943436 RepID=UPI002445A73A|nr:uncharacterized protein LOC129595258 [Paramacrobiotus metropolitanus]